jgi:hypothetical protein
MCAILLALFVQACNYSGLNLKEPKMAQQTTAEVAHIITNESTGTGLGVTVTAVCTCGWRGTPRFGYDDYQSTNVQLDSARHQSSINATADAMRFAAGIACADTTGGLSA